MGFPPRPEWLAGAALAGMAVWFVLSRRTGRWPAAVGFLPGLLGWAAPAVFKRLLVPPLASLSFSHLGALRWGERWVETSPGGYLCMGFLGLVLMGLVLGIAAAWWRSSRTPWVVFALALFAAGAWRTLVFPPTGDEPYILLSTSSLLQGGNLDLSDDLARGADRDIHPVPFRDDLMKHHRVPGRRGETYTYHGLALPFLYLPGYALLGRVGLAALLAALAALLLAGIHGFLRSPGMSGAASRTTAGILAIASPLPVFTVFLSPDLPTAALVALGAAGCLMGHTGLLLAAVTALPWVHHKAVLLGLGLVVGAALTLGWRKAAVALALLAVSLLGLLLVAARSTSMPVWPPSDFLAFYSSQYQGGFDVRTVPAALFGTLFDRHQGAVFFPALLLSLAGLSLLPRRPARLVAAAAAPYLIALLMFSQWAGGSGAPGRMLVVILPLLAFPLAAVAGRLQSRGWGRWLIRLVFAGGALLLWVLSAVPALCFTSARERVEQAVAAKIGVNPLGFLPDLARGIPSGSSLATGAAWTALLALIVFILIRLLRSGKR